MTIPGRLVLLGHPVAHSLSPIFQNAALQATGVPLTYEPLDVAPHELKRRLAELATARAAGNVTIPHKEAVLAACANVSELARRAQAANVFRTGDDGALAGDNTDVAGFEALARRVLGEPPTGLRVAVLGAGGGAAAVLAALERWRAARVTLYNRSMDRAKALAARFPIVHRVEPSAKLAVRDADLVVNASAIGMVDDSMPVFLDVLPSDAAVLDLVYRREGTAWVRAAREAGHRAADGLEMLLEQGALAFEFWLGIPAPREVMRDALS